MRSYPLGEVFSYWSLYRKLSFASSFGYDLCDLGFGEGALYIIDGSEASAAAIRHYDASHPTAMVTPQVRYPNDGVEQDHGAAKRIVRGTLWLLSSSPTAGYICSPMSTPNALIRGTALASCARVGFHNPPKSFWLSEATLQGEGSIAIDPYDACQGVFHL